MRPIRITFWLNAFIPRDVLKANGNKRSKSRPGHKDETMIPGPIPLVSDCFSTDNRSFSSNPKAKSRMHSELIIKLENGQATHTQAHWCSPTREFDCEDGALEGTARGSTKRMAFTVARPSSSAASHWIRANLKAATNNPLFRGSPQINYNGALNCIIIPNSNISLIFSGEVDEFPAFEAYAALNGGIPKTLFQAPPRPGNTPFDLYGDANQAVSGIASWPWPS